MKRTNALAILVALCFGPTGWADDGVNAALRYYFPGRDMTKSTLKIVDYANGDYVVGESVEILKDGKIRARNAAAIRKLKGEPNQAPRYSSYDGPRLILTFEKPIKTLEDLKANKLESVEELPEVGQNKKPD